MRQVVPHPVRCPPANVLAQVRADDLDCLSTDADPEKENTGPHEAAQGTVGLGGIDEVANDLRPEQTEADAARYANGEKGDAALVRR